MGRISAGVGLISGLNTQDLIEKLLAVESRPLGLLQTQIETRTTQQQALLALSADLLALQNFGTTFSSPDTLNARTATSSAPAILTATAKSTAAPGTYQFRPLRLAQTQRILSRGFADASSTPIGAGTISIKLGGFVNSSTSLEFLNGGSGVPAGKIRLTDRSGATEVIDLGAARTVADVLQAINKAETVRVQAKTQGDKLVLTDLSGGTGSVTVDEVAGGATAAGLGILGTIAGATLVGGDIVGLGPNVQLGLLNDGNGVRRATGLDDFRVTLADGSQVAVSLGTAATIQQALDAINNDTENAGKLTASIDATGDRLVLTDNTAGGGTLLVEKLNGSEAARDLGLLGGTAAGGTLTGRRLLAGLESVLLNNLNGGAGIATPGSIQLTDRSGATATVDLTAAETLAEVIDAINASGLGLVASLNAVANGIQIKDTTGATASALIVADVGGGTTAADLKIAGTAAADVVNSGDLNHRYLSENTLLSRLNGGRGIQKGQFRVTDSNGQIATINLTADTVRTLGDVIFALNTTGIGISARINDTGDGILVSDTAGGAAGIKIEELAGSTAADLKLLGSDTTSIDGAYRYAIDVAAGDTLQALAKKIADSGAPVTASVVNTGGAVDPYRLMLTSKRSGFAGRLSIDAGSLGLDLKTFTEGADALVELAGDVEGGPPLVLSSTSNTLADVVPGLTIELLGTSTSTVTVTVGQNSAPLGEAIDGFVQAFNGIVSALKKLTLFDSETQQRGTLQGDRTALQVQNVLFRLIGESTGGGSIRNLADLGITVRDGQLTLRPETLEARLSQDPEGVRDFLGKATTGLADRLKNTLKGLTNQFDGVIARRVGVLKENVTDLEDRTDRLTARIEVRRLILSRQFLGLEQTLAQLRGQQESLSKIVALAPLQPRSRN